MAPSPRAIVGRPVAWPTRGARRATRDADPGRRPVHALIYGRTTGPRTAHTILSLGCDAVRLPAEKSIQSLQPFC